MESLPTPTNNSSRPEIDHSKSENNLLLKLKYESYSQPTRYNYRPANTSHQAQNNELNENTPTQPQISNTTNQNQNDRLQIHFTDFVNNHRQFSFTNNEGFAPIDGTTGDTCLNDRESSVEPSPSPSPSPSLSATPIVSDLDELLAYTPTMQRISHEMNSSKSANAPSFPLPGLSIPYNMSDDEESDTPEPCDTPQGSEFICSINPYFEETKLTSSDESDLDYDEFMSESMDIASPLHALHATLSPKSKSWQKITMTRMNYKRCKKIKCITPISQETAEWNLNNYNIQNRRRSVANITPSVHKLFKLDADLLKIREEFLKRTQTKSDDDENELDDHEFGAKSTGIFDESKEHKNTEISDKDMNENENGNKKENNYNNAYVLLTNSNVYIVIIAIFITLIGYNIFFSEQKR